MLQIRLINRTPLPAVGPSSVELYSPRKLNEIEFFAAILKHIKM